METGILLAPALALLLYAQAGGVGAFVHAGPITTLLLIVAGPVTAFPLLLFAAAAQRIPLSTIGVLQYANPILQFLLGVLVYGEPFDQARAIGFGMVWLALILFMGEGFLARRTATAAHPEQS